MNYLNGTGYDSSQPWGENWADWSSASWGNNWAGTPGGVARQLGLEGRSMAGFARAVNNQKRRLAEVAGGGSYGYNPNIELPSWIQSLYESKGINTGGRTPTGKSGVGKYVDLGAIGMSGGQSAGPSGGRQGSYGGGSTPMGKARAAGLKGREAVNFARQYNANLRAGRAGEARPTRGPSRPTR